MPEASHAAARGADAYRECLVQLGAEGHLVGTLVQPTGPSASVGVLFVNAGVIHRIGPHRIHVKIGRVLAQDGVPSLRLDLTGLGDSGRAGGTDGMLAQVRRDIRAALDLLAERTGLSRFVIIGICSGAEYGYQYALDDERVAGLVMVDGYSFGNRRTRMLRYLLRLRTLTWPVLKNAVLGTAACGWWPARDTGGLRAARADGDGFWRGAGRARTAGLPLLSGVHRQCAAALQPCQPVR